MCILYIFSGWLTLKTTPFLVGIRAPPIMWSVEPTEFHNETACRSGQPFFYSSPESAYILQWGSTCPPKKLRLHLGGSGHSPNTWFLGPTIQTASQLVHRFVRLTDVTNRQTDTHTDHATSIATGHIFALWLAANTHKSYCFEKLAHPVVILENIFNKK